MSVMPVNVRYQVVFRLEEVVPLALCPETLMFPSLHRR